MTPPSDSNVASDAQPATAEVAEPATTGAAWVIPATKVHIPVVRPGLVPRDALIDALVQARPAKLTLVDAPAGFGKTTLLAAWCASPREDRPFAWISLDEDDNDPVRFWSGVIDAIATVVPDFGESPRAALQTRNVGLVEVAVPLIVNDLARLPGPLVLVLDDYHLVTEEQVHRSVAYLLDHLAHDVHLVIATRLDPPLPLGRLRARGVMTELRAAELRLSREEAAGLLRAALDVGLGPEEVAQLHERTEGWPAGLYLAALSLRGRTNPRGFIASFAGDDRQIVDYLGAEVLAGQPRDLREFLLRTSVLQRLCGPLCDEVTGGRDSAATLERVERFNLFLVPLDNNRTWYRYHNLFRELLLHELERTGLDALPELHRRASAWFRSRSMVSEAVHHATAAGDHDDARDLIADNWNELFNQGRLETVAAWIGAIPREAVIGDARVCVAAAWLAMDSGRVEEAERWIEAADAALAGGDGDRRPVAEIAVLRAVHGFKVGDVGRAREAALRILELGANAPAFPRFVAHCILGVALYWRGEPAGAREALEEAVRLARSDGNDLGHSYALGYLALLQVEEGRLEAAERLARDATELSDDSGFREHFVTMVGRLALGRVEQRRGRLDSAERTMRRSLELAGRGAGALERADALIGLAGVRDARGYRDDAGRLLADARAILKRCPDAGAVIARRADGQRPSTAAAHDTNGVEDLTDRELTVLRMLTSELSRREIGDALFVSLDTVKSHLRGIYRKLGATTRQEALERARSLGLL